MNNMRIVFVALCAAAVLTGCAEYSPYKYSTGTMMTKPVESYDKHFEDGNIDIRFQVKEKRILFLLKNKTKNSITLRWDKVSYIDSGGNTHAAAGTDALFSPKMEEPSPASVEAGQKIEDVVVPVKNVEPREEWSWYIRPLFELKNEEALQNIGKEFSLLMPMEIEGKIVDYKFDFTIYHVTPRTLVIN